MATQEDLELQGLGKAVACGGVKVPVELSKCSKVLSQISVTEDGIVLRGSRNVVPEKLRLRVLKFAHGGHQDISKTKALIRSRVWFPGIDNMVERMVKLFRECQANSNRQNFEPLRPSKMPDQPWKEVSGTCSVPWMMVVTGLSTIATIRGGRRWTESLLSQRIKLRNR